MRIVVTGATGNVGTGVVQALAADEAVHEIVGVARRQPGLDVPKVRWVRADVTTDDLAPAFRGADVVVHLAWLLQPSHRQQVLRRVNVDGSRRVFRAVADAGVPALVYASSVGAYSPGPKDYAVDEGWPTEGIATSFYGRQKAAVERLLDEFEAEHPTVRAVRLRKALVFKREAGSEVARLFMGPLLPTRLVHPRFVPAVPATSGLVFQAVHGDDVSEAYRLAVVGEARGAFNIAAEPVLDAGSLARLLRARTVPVPPRLLRAGAALTWRTRLQPTEPGWVDLALNAPVMSTERARAELGWHPSHRSDEAVAELLSGIREKAGLDTPPLEPFSKRRAA